MDIEKKCLWCGGTYIAHTMYSRYCSKQCNGATYKSRIREEKLKKLQEENESSVPHVKKVDSKEYFTPREAATLLGLGKTTIYRYLVNETIKSLHLKRKTIIRRSDLEKLFDEAAPYRKQKSKVKENQEYYTMKEIEAKYPLKKKAIWKRLDK